MISSLDMGCSKGHCACKLGYSEPGALSPPLDPSRRDETRTLRLMKISNWSLLRRAMFPRLASLTVLKLPRRLALPVMMVGALEYSCAPDFSQLTMDNGVGGRAGSSECDGESCGGMAAESGRAHAGTPNTSAGGSVEGGQAGEGGVGGENPGEQAGQAGDGGGSADGEAGQAGAPNGGAAQGGTGGAAGAGQGGTGQGGTGGNGGTGGGLEPDPDLPVLTCGSTPCSDPNTIVDFEANDGRVCDTNGRSGITNVYGDGTGEQWPLAGANGLSKFSPMSACRGQSAVAFHTKGDGFTSWGAGAVMRFAPAGGWDASAFSGISFWAMSPTRTRITFGIPTVETQDVAYDGQCVPKNGLQCSDHFVAGRSIGVTWMAYTILFSEMKQRGFGVPAPSTNINPAKLLELNITFPPGQPFDIWFDDISFTK